MKITAAFRTNGENSDRIGVRTMASSARALRLTTIAAKKGSSFVSQGRAGCVQISIIAGSHQGLVE
jgi:hypothetical protein